MYPVRRQISPHASSLRKNATDAERLLWSVLRNRQLGGYKFRFQTSVGPYIADFLCVEASLIVEVDGGQHSVIVDAARTQFLEGMGYRVIRFWNNEVIENLPGVAEAILAAAAQQRR
jgi:very-short-patch-repair endonuclease